ncbi:MAG TPA: oligosaccharide flippase family protein [Ignavibacteriaceae bacterium]|nr:oligosaccharide flippase family protein [Ignavibacteriaceae bacterium]
MLDKLKYLVKHSFIYSISNLATKASGVILLPIYSTFFSVSEFGILGIIEVTISIFTELLNFGLGQSLVMLTNHTDFENKKSSIFYTLTIVSAFIVIIFIALGEITVPYLSKLFQNPSDFYFYLRLAIYIISLRVLNIFFSNKLRADEKSIWFTASSLTKLGLTLGFIVYFVAYRNLGISGVLYSYILSEAVLFLILIPSMIRGMTKRFEKDIIRVAISFGFPMIFTSVAMLILNVSDRYILKYFTNYKELGLYDLGYRISGVVNMFVIMPFNLALMPFAYKIYQQEGDKRYFSKLLTYLTLLLVWISLALSLFSGNIIKIFALNPEYWEAAKVIPVIVFSYIFFGMRIVVTLGMLLTKNTKALAYTTLFASGLNIILNIIFIPLWGMMAAAYSTLVSFIFLYWLSYIISQKYYSIPYENMKVYITVLIGAALYIISLTINLSYLLDIIVKFVLLLVFPFILYFIKFFEIRELESLAGFYRKWKNPVTWRKNIKGTGNE